MHRVTGAIFETLDFVPDHQFSTLEFDDTEIVGRQVHERFVQFAFENFVLAFQFDEMRL
jgi:hypothetical protein